MHLLGATAALTSSFLWAIASLLFASLGRRVHPVTLNLLKCLLGGSLALLSLLLLEGALWPSLPASATLLLAASALVGLTLGDTAYFLALVRLGPRRSLLVTALSPPITAALGAVFLSESLTLLQITGMLVTIGGVTWVIRERAPGGGPRPGSELAGLLFGVLAALCQSVGAILTKHADTIAPELTPLSASSVRLTFGCLGLFAVALATGRLREVVVPFRVRFDAVQLVAATLLGTYLGVWLMNAGLLWTWVGVASTLNSTSPLFVLPLAAFVLHERLSARAIAGAVVSVVGISLLFVSH
jgi:drug/metabolite transporter (DMT)-like permease